MKIAHDMPMTTASASPTRATIVVCPSAASIGLMICGLPIVSRTTSCGGGSRNRRLSESSRYETAYQITRMPTTASTIGTALDPARRSVDVR